MKIIIDNVDCIMSDERVKELEQKGFIIKTELKLSFFNNSLVKHTYLQPKEIIVECLDDLYIYLNKLGESYLLNLNDDLSFTITIYDDYIE